MKTYEDLAKLRQARDKSHEKLVEVTKNYKEVSELAEKLVGLCIGKSFSFKMFGDDMDPDLLVAMKDTMRLTTKGTKLLDDLVEIEVDTNRQISSLTYDVEYGMAELSNKIDRIMEKLDEKLERKAIVQVEKKD